MPHFHSRIRPKSVHPFSLGIRNLFITLFVEELASSWEEPFVWTRDEFPLIGEFEIPQTHRAHRLEL